MKQAFKFRIVPCRVVERQLDETLDLCRELHNAAIQERRDAYRMCGVSLNYRTQANQLPAVKALRPDVAGVHSQVLQQVLKRVEAAFEGFFRRVKAGSQPGYPRFRGKGRYDSLTYPQSGWKLEGDKLHLSKIGSMRIRLSRPIQGQIKTVTIKREGARWSAVFTCEVEATDWRVAAGAAEASCSLNVVGIDVGLEAFYTDSDGRRVENPRHLRQAEARLKQEQRKLSRKKKFSTRRRQQRMRVAKLHGKVANQRKDFLHKLSTKLVRRYDAICFENLNIREMVRNHHLAKSISDAAWGMFLEMLVYKAEWASKRAVNVNPKGTSQECSGCHEKVPKGLSVRWHKCPHCQLELHRDLNAALNILARGIELLLAAGHAVTAHGGRALAVPMKCEPLQSASSLALRAARS